MSWRLVPLLALLAWPALAQPTGRDTPQAIDPRTGLPPTDARPMPEPTPPDGTARGVVIPPNPDPGILVPPPIAGQTPVIPPPGTPGGDPKVQPR